MTGFSARIEQVSISGIREVFEAAGEDAVNLGLGQPDFPAPPHARDAAVEAIEGGTADAYTENRGLLALRDAVAEKFETDLGVSVDPDAVIATAGGSEALHIALEAHVDPGDEVLVPDPGFVAYDALVRLAGGTPVPVELRDDLTLSPAAVEEAITDDTVAFVVNSPANPTGTVASAADVRGFARIADEHDVLCLSDEVYEEMVFDGEHYSPMEFASTDNVAVVGSCSKTYSMTGWRLGWVVASERRSERMLKAHQYVQACATAASQYAAEAALTGPQGHVEEMVAAFRERRDVLLDGFEEMGLDTPRPEGAFYAMPRVPEGWVDEVLARDVIVVPGDAFGERGAGHARISYATDTKSIKTAIEAMRAATRATRDR
ncbi:aspartate aminotransferase [Halobacteriales archaeon SW_7_68_16]|nr:MAG: aspartate aminotransferase [Halobacteriales archaeon SW_7_68_16]